MEKWKSMLATPSIDKVIEGFSIELMFCSTRFDSGKKFESDLQALLMSLLMFLCGTRKYRAADHPNRNGSCTGFASGEFRGF